MPWDALLFPIFTNELNPVQPVAVSMGDFLMMSGTKNLFIGDPSQRKE